jgi:hypothetical protein
VLFKSKNKHVIEQEKKIYTIDLEEIRVSQLNDVLNMVPSLLPRYLQEKTILAINCRWTSSTNGFTRS